MHIIMHPLSIYKLSPSDLKDPKMICNWPPTLIWKYVVPGTLRTKDMRHKRSLRNNIFKDLHHIFSIFQKQQIYKLISRHRVARYELVGLLFLKNRENVAQIFEYVVSERTFVEIFEYVVSERTFLSRVFGFEGSWNNILSDEGRRPITDNFWGPWDSLFENY